MFDGARAILDVNGWLLENFSKDSQPYWSLFHATNIGHLLSGEKKAVPEKSP